MADEPNRASNAVNSGVPATAGSSGAGASQSISPDAWKMRRDELASWAQTTYGKPVDPNSIVREEIRDPLTKQLFGAKYTFRLADGTQVSAMDAQPVAGQPQGFIPEAHKDPTSTKAGYDQVSAPPTQREIVYRKPEGSYKPGESPYQIDRNPNYVDPNALSEKDRYDISRTQRADEVAEQTRRDAAAERNTDRAIRSDERADDKDERAADRATKAELDRYGATVKQWEADAAARREAAQAERDRLRFLLDERKITFDEAQAQYDRWWGENVELPFKQASEARARTKESNDALEAEQAHKDYVAEYEAKRAQFGYGAEQDVVNNQMNLLKYTWGPTAPESFAANISALAKGKSGPGFQASDFRISLPKALAEVNGMSLDQAAARALKGWSPYAEQIANVAPVGYGVTDHSAIPIPNAAGAPQMPMQPGEGLPQWSAAAAPGQGPQMPQFPTIAPYAPPVRAAPPATALSPAIPPVVPAMPLPYVDPALSGGVQ